jgi:hypothetical protein
MPRLAVEPILSQLGERTTEADLMHADPRLTRQGIQVALTYAVDVLAPELGCCRWLDERRRAARACRRTP